MSVCCVIYLVDIDNSWGAPARRIRASISSDDLDYSHVQESDVFDTLAIPNGSSTVGHSHRGDRRLAIPIIVERPRGQKQLDEQTPTTPPGGRHDR